MRLYHPTTLSILSKREDIPKRYSCSVWSEVFKSKASKIPHPKVFITDDYTLGQYLSIVYWFAIEKGCNLDMEKLRALSPTIYKGFCAKQEDFNEIEAGFNDSYLFSDAVSLYNKGINIFPNLFPNNPRKYIPVESHKEIARQALKTVTNKPVSDKLISKLIKLIKEENI